MFGKCVSRHAIASLATQLRSDHPPGMLISRKKWAIDFFVTLKPYPTERKKIMKIVDWNTEHIVEHLVEWNIIEKVIVF